MGNGMGVVYRWLGVRPTIAGSLEFFVKKTGENSQATRMVRVLEEGFFWIGSMKVDSFSRHLFFFFGKEIMDENPSKV